MFPGLVSEAGEETSEAPQKAEALYGRLEAGE